VGESGESGESGKLRVALPSPDNHSNEYLKLQGGAGDGVGESNRQIKI
jgi:hypothetical protein